MARKQPRVKKTKQQKNVSTPRGYNFLKKNKFPDNAGVCVCVCVCGVNRSLNKQFCSSSQTVHCQLYYEKRKKSELQMLKLYCRFRQTRDSKGVLIPVRIARGATVQQLIDAVRDKILNKSVAVELPEVTLWFCYHLNLARKGMPCVDSIINLTFQHVSVFNCRGRRLPAGRKNIGTIFEVGWALF